MSKPKPPSAKEAEEERFLNRMLQELGWPRKYERVRPDPPDFKISYSGVSCSVEVTRIFLKESSRGSALAAQEAEFAEFVQRLRDSYFAWPAHQELQVEVTFPDTILTPPKRKFRKHERQADLTRISTEALVKLQQMPDLSPSDEQKFRLHQQDKRAVLFKATRLQNGLGADRLWEAINNHVGWVGQIDKQVQEKIAVKNKDLPGYRKNFDRALLLIVADARKASGFLELPDAFRFEPLGFDAVYFQSQLAPTREVAKKI